jgi:hypothetical protein
MTRADFEKHLNEQYLDVYNSSDVLEAFEGLGTDKQIRSAWMEGALGTFLRRKDPIQFDVMYQERCRELV